MVLNRYQRGCFGCHDDVTSCKSEPIVECQHNDELGYKNAVTCCRDKDFCNNYLLPTLAPSTTTPGQCPGVGVCHGLHASDVLGASSSAVLVARPTKL